MSASSIARALTREVSKGRIMSPLRGFYVIVPDEYVLRGCGLILVDAWDMNQKGLASIFTNAHHGPREIYVMEIVLHSWDVLEPVLFRITSTRTFVL